MDVVLKPTKLKHKVIIANLCTCLVLHYGIVATFECICLLFLITEFV